jgi:hypothetical protein
LSSLSFPPFTGFRRRPRSSTFELGAWG